MRPSGQTLSFVTITMFPISATVIRRKLQRSRSARHLLPGDVADLRRAARALLRVRTSFPTADGNARCGRASGSTRQ